jgi:hypothetical protein
MYPEETVPEILRGAVKPATTKPLFSPWYLTGGYGPKWFKKLWGEHPAAIIPYRKNVQGKWDEKTFRDTDIRL